MQLQSCQLVSQFSCEVCWFSQLYKEEKQQFLLTFFTIDIKMHQKQVWFFCSTYSTSNTINFEDQNCLSYTFKNGLPSLDPWPVTPGF